MKILHFVPNINRDSGIINVVMKYYKYLYSDIQFDFLCFEKGNSTFEKEIEFYGGNVHYIVSPKNLIKFNSDLNIFYNKHYLEYDILHIHLPFLNYAFFNSKKKLGVKEIISHAHATRFGENKLSNYRNKIFFMFGKHIPDFYAACSIEAGIAIFGNDFKKHGYVINNAIELDNYIFNNEERKKYRDSLNIDDKFVIGHIGHFTPQKNHDFLIDIFNEYQKINDKTILLLIGNGYLENYIRTNVEELKLSHKVMFLGNRNDINLILNAFDLFVFPSIFEGLGIVLIEAQANGLRCIMSDQIPLAANVLENQVVPINADVKNWVEAIKKIDSSLSRKDVVEFLSEAGFDIKQEAIKLCKLYYNILEEVKS